MKLIALRVEDSVEAEWKTQAKSAGLTLSAWIREQIKRPRLRIPDDKDYDEMFGSLSPKQKMESAAVNDSNERYYHTAASHRHTCLCPSCCEYRERNAIPFGGFKK